MTPPEAVMWLRLRKRLPGRPNFRRQHGIGPFILDFYCAALKLTVEIDGSAHLTEDGRDEDARRTAWLNTNGIEVVRIAASDVLADADSAAEHVWTIVRARLANQPGSP